MNDPLDELRQKQRKLTYHFGEHVYDLYKTGQIDLAFPSENSAQEEAITKLLKLLRYLDERVSKFEALAVRETEEPASEVPIADAVNDVSRGDAQVPDETTPEENGIRQEPMTAAPEPEVEQTSEVAEEEPEVVPEPVAQEEKMPAEEIPLDIPAEVPSEGTASLASFDEEMESATEALSESITTEPLDVATEEAGTVETTVARQEPEVPEQSDDAGGVPAPEVSPETLTFQHVLANARLKSETEKNLFEDNLDALRAGDERERARALKNLSYLGGKETFQNVCKLAMSDPSAEIRLVALKAIGRTRQPESAELYRVGLRDEDASVRITSIKGLSMLLLSDSAAVLEPMLRDPDAHVRGIAATCLGIYGGAQGVQAASELWKDQNAYVRKSLVDMLAIVRAPGSLAVVKQLLDDQDEGVRRAAENALNKAKPVEAKGKKYGEREKN